MQPLILITNDDGIGADGIAAAAAALAPLGDVMVAAPDRERSAASHSISLDRPLRVDEIRPGWYSIDGTPVDCMYLAILHLVPRKPDLCVSGINNGYNLGSDVFYSGTVAGAVEGVLRGSPAVAVSLARRKPQDFSAAAAFTAALAREALARGPGAIPPGALLNVNLPPGPLRGWQPTHLGRRVYRDQVDVRADLRGRAYYWIGGPEEKSEDEPGSDQAAVNAGLASVTPLDLDLTHEVLGGSLDGWQVGDFVREGRSRAR